MDTVDTQSWVAALRLPFERFQDLNLLIATVSTMDADHSMWA